MATNADSHGLVQGQIYSWEELGQIFAFEPDYLGRVGGMVPRPEQGAVLLITHPGGGRSFDYNDYWDGQDLIYTGRGKHDDQKLEGANRYVAENSHRLLAFEAAGSRTLSYLGQPQCVDWQS